MAEIPRLHLIVYTSNAEGVKDWMSELPELSHFPIADNAHLVFTPKSVEQLVDDARIGAGEGNASGLVVRVEGDIGGYETKMLDAWIRAVQGVTKEALERELAREPSVMDRRRGE